MRSVGIERLQLQSCEWCICMQLRVTGWEVYFGRYIYIYIYIVVCVAMPQYLSCEASTMELLCRQDEKAYFILVIQSAMSVFCTIYVAHKSLFPPSTSHESPSIL